ncbi:MAG: hydrogenase iron-sulfur subunit, partial [Thermoplasmata archaeon]
FFQEAHVKLKPVEFATDGIYLAGCARSPKSLKDTVEEALGTAMRAAIPMKRGYIESDGLIAEIDGEKCMSCELCAETCAYGAVEVLAPAAQEAEGEPAARRSFKVIEALCKGCGSCAAGCPEHAIAMQNFSSEQIEAQIEAGLVNVPAQKQLAFACHWCALGAADLAGVSRLQYPPNVRIIRVMCSGRVDPTFVLSAFARGVPGVLVAGCEIPTCHYISGNIYAGYRMDLVKILMKLAGIEPGRLRVEWLSAAQGDRFARVVDDFNKGTNQLGPLPAEVVSGLDLQAAIACADSDRLRLLVGKLPELAELGNKYGEIFSRHELTRILTEAASDEFVTQKVLILLKHSIMSVKSLAAKLDIAPPRVLRIILDLVHSGNVRRVKIEGTSPVYSAEESAKEAVQQRDEKPISGGVESART